MTSTTLHTRMCTFAALAVFATASAVQSSARADDDPNRSAREREKPLISLRLTMPLLNNLLDKAAERLTKDYGFDDYQQEQMRQVLEQRIPQFLNEHGDDLQHVVDEWLEAVSGDEPPTADYAAEWAARALPLMEAVDGLLDDVSTDMREFLTDEQDVLLDGYRAAIDTGTRNVKARLFEFKEGGFKPEEHWPGYSEVRRANRRNSADLRRDMEAAREHAMGNPLGGGAEQRPAPGAPAAPGPRPEPKRPTVASKSQQPKDEWTKYVDSFIARYQLNDEQRQRAQTFLQRAHEQRDRHLQRNARHIEQLERMYKDAKTPEQRKLAEDKYARVVQKPLDGMFERLKDKLNTLPTRAQKAAAAARQQEAKATKRPAAKAKQPQ